ncbi:MAG: hypothetical protein ACK4XK_13965 [Casimicrobiaceae bacterium]
MKQKMDAHALHDLVASMHLSYYQMGGPERQIDLMLCVVVQGRVGFVELEAGNRDEWYAKAATVLRGLDADLYCVASEAWLAVAKPISDPVSRLTPSQRSDRMEVVATVAVDRSGNTASSVKVIDRHCEGELAGTVRALTDCQGFDGAEGRMFSIFEMAGLT